MGVGNGGRLGGLLCLRGREGRPRPNNWSATSGADAETHTQTVAKLALAKPLGGCQVA